MKLQAIEVMMVVAIIGILTMIIGSFAISRSDSGIAARNQQQAQEHRSELQRDKQQMRRCQTDCREIGAGGFSLDTTTWNCSCSSETGQVLEGP